MMYLAYQSHADALDPLRALARITASALQQSGPGMKKSLWTRSFAAACDVFGNCGLTHGRPSFGIPFVTIDNRAVPVTEEAAFTTPFGTLLHFKKDMDRPQPKVLLVAPLSGHFATLLRGTVETLLVEHDVYITDWHNARDVSLSHGRFGFDEYIEHVIKFLEALGPGAHVIAVCQPCVQVLAAAAIMAETKNPAQPRSMTLMAGPIDASVNPTKVNELATGRSIEWFEHMLISRVPLGFPGASRRVYPGFLQLTAFMSMNLDRHMRAQFDRFHALIKGEHARADATKIFYDEYFAVLDMPAEFYLETVKKVFQDYDLARGALEWRGRKVDPAKIRRTALLTVEGERDDICSVGQTVAAQDLCTGLRPYMKRHHLQAGVGHYGVFAGKRWRNEIYPLVRNHILAAE
ncbi:MAG: polyhydroxyalkanoate depolymerase [Reyranellaceae bacterium]